ncbi:MAG: type II secretion system F family protein [Francisellaceae bacterium]|jgi:type IV pilus assembly protein PilC|nr:type II secretion system F family protein [Francisellaceae bacterium]MBT6208248.1 type II secretion system F family protein [Francisellaceae bacterium]MBT6537876.1 type II secretion system F family protein [Francisellaceae bacterium]
MAKKSISTASEYSYSAKNNNGDKIKGTITAQSISAATALLKRQGLKSISVRKTMNFMKSNTKKVTSEDVTMFTRQMSTMIFSGIPLVKAFDVLIEGLERPGLKNVLTEVKNEIESGSTFSESLGKQPLVFDTLFCSLIEAGEQSGSLDVMLDRIATYKEKTESLKRKIKKALYYPAAVILIATVVTVVLLIKVVPTFEELFAGFGAELPAFTLFVLNISNILQEYGIFVGIAIALIIWMLVRAYKTNTAFKNRIQSTLITLPIVGPLMHKAVVARFGRTLATTFSAGVPLVDALNSVAYATGNVVYTKAILDIKDIVSSGQPVNVAMQQVKIFPTLVVQMVGIGEETGSIDKMLDRIASIYEEEVDMAVDGLTTLLEPAIMAFLGVVVGGLVVAMYLPIFKMGSAI